jgi:hypothetical protein
MKIGDYKQMMAYLTRPEQPKEQVAYLVDDLEPGPLKDELTKDYDPSQESYEEYLQRKALGKRPFNAQNGGRANLAIGGGAIEGEDLGTREGFGSPEAIEYLKSLKPGSAVNTYAIGKQFGIAPATVRGQVERNFPELRLQTKEESVAKATETRRKLYKQKQSDVPVVETKVRGSGKEARTKGRDITGIRFPNEQMKNDYIQDLTNRYSGVKGRKGLTNKELAEKYLGSNNPNDIGRIERINNYFVKNLNLEYEKAPISEVKEKRTRRLAITQGGRSFKGTEDIPFHHIMPIGGEVDLTTKDVAFINKQMNSKLAPYNTKLNDIADGISNQLNNQEPGYLKRIDELNNQAEQIIESVKTRLPKKYQNYIGFNRLDPILDENATPIRLNVTRVGVDDTKSLAGKIGEPVKLEGLTQKNINEIKKLKYRNAIKNFPISTGGPTLGAVGDIGMARDILSRDIETGKRLISEYGPKVLQGARQVTKLAVIPELAFGAAFAPFDLGEGRSGKETLLNVATLGMGVPISDARDRANYVDQFGLKEDLFSAQIKQSGAQYGAPELTEREQLALQKAEEFDTQILQPRLKKTLLERQAASDPNFGTGIMGMANGGLIRQGFADGPKDPGKRKTMKILAGLGSLPILGRFFDVAQVAEKAAPAVVETFKNAPAHFIGLVNKIRALGKIVDPKKLLRSEQDRYSNVYDYGEYRMFERPDGQVEIGKQKLVATEYGDGIVSEEYMSYDPKSPKFNKKGEKIEGEYDEVYEENTTYADQYGEMQDVREGIEPETINDGTYSKEELEQLIIEQIEDSLKKGKK